MYSIIKTTSKCSTSTTGFGVWGMQHFYHRIGKVQKTDKLV